MTRNAIETDALWSIRLIDESIVFVTFEFPNKHLDTIVRSQNAKFEFIEFKYQRHQSTFLFFPKSKRGFKINRFVANFCRISFRSHVFYEADLFLERQMIFISKIIFFNFFNIV